MHMITSNLLKGRMPGHALDRPFYSDPQIFQEDLETIYYQDWLFVTPACELPNTGSYVTYQVGDYQIVLVTDMSQCPLLYSADPLAKPIRLGLLVMDFRLRVC